MIQIFKKGLLGFEKHPDILKKLIEKIENQIIREDKNLTDYIIDLNSLDEKIQANKLGEGFNWKDTDEGYHFWFDVLMKKDFDRFYKFYPMSQTIPVYNITQDTVMEVSNDCLFNDSLIRVVFCYKPELKKYVSWTTDDLTTAKKTITTETWLCAKPVEGETELIEKIDLDISESTEIIDVKLNDLLNNLCKKKNM